MLYRAYQIQFKEKCEKYVCNAKPDETFKYASVFKGIQLRIEQKKSSVNINNIQIINGKSVSKILIFFLYMHFHKIVALVMLQTANIR